MRKKNTKIYKKTLRTTVLVWITNRTKAGSEDAQDSALGHPGTRLVSSKGSWGGVAGDVGGG